MRWWRWLRSLGGWGTASLVLLALTSVGVLSIALSPTSIYWTGTAVHGYEQGGIVYYRYAGKDYTMPGRGSAGDERQVPRTVYLRPSRPTDAMLRNPYGYGADVAFVAVWPVAAAVCLAVGTARRRQRPPLRPLRPVPRTAQD